jgi:hypothetical protein
VLGNGLTPNFNAVSVEGVYSSLPDISPGSEKEEKIRAAGATRALGAWPFW